MNITKACLATLVLVTTVLILTSCIATPASAYVTSFPDEPDIDGALLTVGIVVAEWLAGSLPYPGVSALLLAIIEAWKPKPEDHYWEHVEDKVKEVCGEFINQDNIDQVIVYKNDLVNLLNKYDTAPVHSDGTYPDKNTLADSITTSIISQRYLVEASLMPWSMALHFVDIASVHILVLNDVADLYSSDKSISNWWNDLANELDHYCSYAKKLSTETLQWRKDNVECYIDEASQACLDFEWAGTTCYDHIEVRDHVLNTVDKCVQLHPEHGEEGSCKDTCSNYERAMTRDYVKWFREHVQKAVDQWQELRLRAEKMASVASEYRIPEKKM